MALEFVDIRHRFGGPEILSGISLRAEPGEITCLLGASGCGKTTLLRLTAGLYDVQAGEITLNGEVLAKPKSNPPPEKRPVGLVFQEGALFPHLSALQNVGFGIGKDPQKTERAHDLLAQVGLAGLADAYPHEMSGGQQQRVALARALAPQPDVLLLDEPFASVDVVLRRQLREETRRVLKSRDAITVMVTHDPEEALDIADRIAVMGRGKILQWGTPAEIYGSPNCADVGELFGQGRRLRGERTAGGVTTGFGTWPDSGFAGELPASGAVEIIARPEALTLTPGPGAMVEDVRVLGPMTRVLVAAPNGERLAVHMGDGNGAEPGREVTVEPLPGAVLGFSG